MRHPQRVERLVLLATGGPPPGAPAGAPGPHTPEGRRLLAEAQVPVLVLAGSRDAQRIRATAEAIGREVPGALMLVVDGAGHELVAERPEVVACALLAKAPQRCGPDASDAR